MEFGEEGLYHAHKRTGVSKDDILDLGIKRASRFAGFVTLGILNPDKYLVGKDIESFQNPLSRLCAQLIDGSLVDK